MLDRTTRKEDGAMVDNREIVAKFGVWDLEYDDNGLEVLDRERCLRLLASVPVGRLGLCVRALPVILPVNFTTSVPPWDDEPIVLLRSREGTKLTAALAGSVVAFEVDGYDAIAHTGWSVLVQGTARVLRAPDELVWAAEQPLEPWAISSADSFIALDTDVVRGRGFGIGGPLTF
jgi:nitroimidazol reductase NimA-like FMN-containing flavoprotein (pyridoxamine 5'-phosphate oxidase superfamily)